MKKYLLSLIALLSIIISQIAFAFIVQKIEIKGLQGLSQKTVLSYLPVKVGDNFDLSQSSKVIEELYKTGFFENISLSRHGNTLIVQVNQRPVISNITITGNKAIQTKQLKEALTKNGFVTGQIFDEVLLEKIKLSLEKEYQRIGKHNASVETHVKKEPRNRVSVKIIIFEGKTAKIKKIQIIGTHSFHEKEILNQFILSKTTLLSFFNHNDEYSLEKFEADLEALRSFYMDRGYLKFKIDSHNVSMSPDKKEVYIVINISEGPQYTLGEYTFSETKILSKEELNKLANLKTGKVFSRQEIMGVNKRISDALANKGYAGADVNIIPKLNDEEKTVDVFFSIKPGVKTYVRHIYFSENYRTNDNVLRRAILQEEGAILSKSKINLSKDSLLFLPYIKDVQVLTKPVPNKPDQVDVEYKITERSAAELKAGIGYSKQDKLVFNAGLNHPNILGTGNSLGLNFARNRYSYNASFSYYNPYYTQSGIGRNFGAYMNHFNGNKYNISNYVTNNYGANLGYNIRLRRDDSIHIGIGYDNNRLTVGSNPSQELVDFTNQHGIHFYQLALNCGLIHQSLNRSIFPTKGLFQSINGMVSVPISDNSLEYYTISYLGKYYQPIYRSFIGQLKFHIIYGDGYGKYEHELPFIKNFHAGGMGSVRGYVGNTLGPKDSNGDPIGGNFALDGTIGLIFPNPIGENLRTILFVDGGNAYNAQNGIDLSDIRYSTGIEFDWLSPMGILNFSFAKPLNLKKGDIRETFQFNIGTTF